MGVHILMVVSAEQVASCLSVLRQYEREERKATGALGIRRDEHPDEVPRMRLEARLRLQIGECEARLDGPDVDDTLKMREKHERAEAALASNWKRTLWFPPTSAEPSEAMETDRIGTSSSGSCIKARRSELRFPSVRTASAIDMHSPRSTET